jgi:hypothetical protein
MPLRTFARASVLALSFGAASLVAGSPAGCAADEGTTGTRVALELRVVGSAGATSAFTNAAGWSVTLSRAIVSTGAMTFFEGATIFSGRGPLPPSPRGLSLGGRTAFAHPGHYVEGAAQGEVRVAGSVDLRAPVASVGRGEGVSGIVRSATFAFGAPAAGPFAAELGDRVAVLEGTATKGSDARLFRAEISASDVASSRRTPTVEGCAFAETDVETDGTVTLTVKVEAWLDQVDFAEVPASADGQPVLVPAGSVARNALVRGMKSGAPYAFAFDAAR